MREALAFAVRENVRQLDVPAHGRRRARRVRFGVDGPADDADVVAAGQAAGAAGARRRGGRAALDALFHAGAHLLHGPLEEQPRAGLGLLVVAGGGGGDEAEGEGGGGLHLAFVIRARGQLISELGGRRAQVWEQVWSDSGASSFYCARLYSPVAQPRVGRANQKPPEGGRVGARNRARRRCTCGVLER